MSGTAVVLLPGDRGLGVACCALAFPRPLLRAQDLPDLFAERVKSCVTVEFLIETELDRQPVTVLGTCIDANGTIILPASAIGSRVSVRQLKDFKVYRPDHATAYAAEYLGQDVLTGWHFVRAEEKLRAGLVPLTAWVRLHAGAAPGGRSLEHRPAGQGRGLPPVFSHQPCRHSSSPCHS